MRYECSLLLERLGRLSSGSNYRQAPEGCQANKSRNLDEVHLDLRDLHFWLIPSGGTAVAKVCNADLGDQFPLGRLFSHFLLW